MKLRGNSIFKIIDRYIGIPLVWFAGLGTRRRELPAQGVSSIVVIKLSALGDTILLIPALRALKQQYPQARVTAVCTKINHEIVASCPYIDDMITINVAHLVTNGRKDIQKIRSVRPDLAFDFDQWLRLSPLLAVLSGARFRAGFRTAGQYRHYAYHRAIQHGKGMHEVENFMALAGAPANADRSLAFMVLPEAWHSSDRIRVAAQLLEKKYIVFHPETPAHARQRQWPVERYIELGKRLHELHQLSIVIGGTHKDAEERQQMAAAIGSHAHALPQMTVPEYAALLADSVALVCGNTGIMHLGCAVNIPVIGLHGPTNPAQWGPWGPLAVTLKATMPCSPCLYLGFEYQCDTNDCMKNIHVSDVLAALQNILH
jgi:ADP-heptose:LPS heptosyltransferase